MKLINHDNWERSKERLTAFWQREIDGPIHSVRVASAALTRPAELRYANGVFTLH